MSRLFASVRARATLAATLVVAVALVAAGTAVLLSLRSNLLGEAGTQAERSARDVATELAFGTAYGDLSLDVDDRPVQVVDDRGRLVAASEDLERISGTGVDAVKPQPAASPGGEDDDADDDDDSGESLEPGEIGGRITVSDGSATIDGDTEDYRFAAVPVKTDDRGTLTVYAGARSPPNTVP